MTVAKVIPATMPASVLPVLPFPHWDSDKGLGGYLAEIQKFPLLGAEEEVSLARRWRENEDVSAAHQLVTSHLRLVVKVARGYRGYGLPFSDLIAEGNIGLMQAVRGFDPERGFRLSTYALWWVKASITEYVLRSWSLVKIGTVAAQKKLFFGLNKIKNKLGILERGDLSPDDTARISQALSVPEQDVVAMNRRLLARDSSLNQPAGEAESGEYIDLLPDEALGPEESLAESHESVHRRALLVQALEILNDRERDILRQRRLSDDPPTLEALAARYGISRERVRQIEARAFEKLRTDILAQAQNLDEQAMAVLETLSVKEVVPA